MYVCMYVYVYVCLCMHVHAHAHVHVHLHMYVHVHVFSLAQRSIPVFAFLSAPTDRKANTFHRSLERNQLGPEGGAALAEGLKGNSTFTSLK